MKTLKFILCAVATLASLHAMAQASDEWLLENRRPDCLYGVEDKEATTHLYHQGPRRVGTQETAALKAQGKKKVPVVLVAFQDLAFSASDVVEKDNDGNIVSVVKGTDAEVNAFYQKFCNGNMDGTRYSAHGSYASIRDFFVMQSDSIFQPEFVVIGPVTLSKGYAYYGANSGNNKDVKFSEFRAEAITKAMEQFADWQQFDNDNNGTIDMVFFLYAGVGENVRGVDSNHIWPKESPTAVTINGKVFSVSAATCEARPLVWNEAHTEILETQTDGVGVFIHELSHALGLPDFYDYDNVAFGMDLWSVMDYGEYCGNGYYPTGYTAYERDFMGWRPLKTLTEPTVLTLHSFSEGGHGYKIINEANPDEYYIIENRQAQGWDRILGLNYGHGLQVTHVDYLASKWSDNRLNTGDPSHQRMTIIPANGSEVSANNATSNSEWATAKRGNLYPGTSENYSLTDESSPAATVFAGGFMHQPIHSITENADGTVTICFRTHGKLDVPSPLEASAIEMDEFQANWGTVENATRYVYEIYQDATLLLRDTLTTAARHLDSLIPGTLYSHRVKALADSPEDYIESEWSELLPVQTLSPVTITAADLEVEYGEQLPVLTYIIDGTDISGEPLLTCEVTPETPVGQYEISVSAGTIASHNVTYVPGLLTITPAPLTVTALDATREQGTENPPFLASYAGFKNGEDESVLTTLPLFQCQATAESPVGQYEIQVFGAEAPNYTIGYVSGTLTVQPPVGVTAVPDSEQPVSVYTPSGILIGHCPASAVLLSVQRRGIYVLRYADGTTRKLYIR